MKKQLTDKHIHISSLDEVQALSTRYSRLLPVTFICTKCQEVELLKMNAIMKRTSLLCHKCLLQNNSISYKTDFPLNELDLKTITKLISPLQVISFICKECGKTSLILYRHFTGLCEHCHRSISSKRIQSKLSVKEKRKATMLLRYGYASLFEDLSYMKLCWEKKYGVGITGAMLIKSILEKQKQTMFERYGGYTLQSEDLRLKVIDTTRQIYGTDNIRNSEYYLDRYKLFKDKLYKNMKKVYQLDNINFDSSWEVAYYIWLRDNNINFVYHPLPGIIYYSEGIDHTYYPDFNVDGKLIEIKGGLFFNKDGSFKIKCLQDIDKYNCMINNNVIIYKRKDILQYLKYVLSKYGTTYLKSLKKF